MVGDLRGRVLEAGVGTGRNLKYYRTDVELTAIDLSPAMLKRAKRRARHAGCRVDFVLEDACNMESIPSDSYDWVIATYLCCVIPQELQRPALEQFARVLKPGGRFRLLEMIYSKTPRIRKRQDFFAPFVEKVYGARFDRHTLAHLTGMGKLTVTGTRFLKDDVYLLMEGMKENGARGDIIASSISQNIHS